MPQSEYQFDENNLSSNVRTLQPSATVAINELANKLIAEGRQVYKWGLGQSPFPVPDCVVTALQENAHQKDYLAVAGLYELRDVVAKLHASKYEVEANADDVIIGPGSKELMFLLQVAFDGQLIIPSPSWVSYEPQARIIGREVFSIDTRADQQWHVTAESLESFCIKNQTSKARILVLNYPSNPTGRSIPATELAELAAVARKYRVLILSDEIYGRVHHRGDHQSIVSLYPEGTILSTGLSKWCGAGGWRLGLFVFPKSLRRLLQAMAAIASETYTSTSAPIQYAAIRAFQGGKEIEDYLFHSRKVLNKIGAWLADQLRQMGASVVEPEGGFYLFPDFSPLKSKLSNAGIHTSKDLCERILKESGVAFLPGSAFGRPNEELTARIAYVDFDGKKALEASRDTPSESQLSDGFLTANCSSILAATTCLKNFFEKVA